MVGPVSIPAAVDQPQFVVQVAPNRVDVDEFNRWAAPLNDSIARAVAGDLVVLLGTPDVATAPLANFNPAYRVTIDVQRFESVQGQAADARGGVDRAQARRAAATALGPHGRARAACRATASTRSPPRTAARSRKLSADIAAAIRAEAEDRSQGDRPQADRSPVAGASAAGESAAVR